MVFSSDSFGNDSFDSQSFDFLGTITRAVEESVDIPEPAKDIVKLWLAEKFNSAWKNFIELQEELGKLSPEVDPDELIENLEFLHKIVELLLNI